MDEGEGTVALEPLELWLLFAFLADGATCAGVLLLVVLLFDFLFCRVIGLFSSTSESDDSSSLSSPAAALVAAPVAVVEDLFFFLFFFFFDFVDVLSLPNAPGRDDLFSFETWAAPVRSPLKTLKMPRGTMMAAARRKYS